MKLFDDFFTEIYGSRWSQIKIALKEDDEKVARRNLFYVGPPSIEEFDHAFGIQKPHPTLHNCFMINDKFDINQFDTHLLPFYRMDPASLYPALALEARPGECVLDMCAAPGGKTLILLEAMQGEGILVANELSPKRRHRLMSVVKRYIPQEKRKFVQITGQDGSRIGLKKKDEYDRILLDAPCSGERGVVHKLSDLEQWKPKRTKSFGIRQYALLASAFMALKPGGRIVYSTCSISPFENDGVIDKLEKKQGGKFQILTGEKGIDKANQSLKELLKDRGEKTSWGHQFLPDINGWGPIYFAVIEKTKI